MTSTIEVKKIEPNARYYVRKDYDERFGGTYWVFLEPIIAVGDVPTFFVTKGYTDGFNVSGEGFILTKEESLAKHKAKCNQLCTEKRTNYRWDKAYFTPLLIDLDDTGNRKKLFVIDQQKLEAKWPEKTQDKLIAMDECADRYIECYTAREEGFVVYEEEREVVSC